MGKFAFCIVKICLVAQINLVCGCGLMSRDTDPGAAGADAAAGEKAAAEWQGDPVPYKTEIVVDGPKYLMDKMRGVSQLAQLEKEAPDSVLALERRAREDQETAIRLLQSQCYYDGEASFSMDDKVKPVLVTLKLVAGPRYKVGHALVHYVPKPVIPEGFRNRFRETGFWGLQKEAHRGRPRVYCNVRIEQMPGLVQRIDGFFHLRERIAGFAQIVRNGGDGGQHIIGHNGLAGFHSRHCFGK